MAKEPTSDTSNSPAVPEAGKAISPSGVAARATTHRMLVFAAVMATTFMVAIEINIVATAMPSIVPQLGGFDLYSWVFAAFLLPQAVTIPIYGKFADLYGRRRILVGGIVVFLIASLLCGLATSMPELIAFRVLQGIGGGAILPVAHTVVGDIFTPEERARMQSYIATVWATSAIVGPALGAAIVANLDWRWVFWINLPLGIVALVMLRLVGCLVSRRRRFISNYRRTAGSGLRHDGARGWRLGRVFGKPSSSIYFQLSPHGGIRPSPRRRSRLALSLWEREEISRGIVARHSIRSMALLLSRSPSTVSREVRRNGGYDQYRAALADDMAWARARRPKRCKLALSSGMRRVVAMKLGLNWSPEQIAGWLKRAHPGAGSYQVSHETIYRSLFVQARGVLKKELLQHLRSKRTIRRSKEARRKGVGRGQITDMVSIRERPASVEDRAVPGHWEGDLLSGSKNSYIATLVERQTRYVMLVKVANKETLTVVSALIRQARKLPTELYKSLTWDRGKELADHRGSAPPSVAINGSRTDASSCSRRTHKVLDDFAGGRDIGQTCEGSVVEPPIRTPNKSTRAPEERPATARVVFEFFGSAFAVPGVRQRHTQHNRQHAQRHHERRHIKHSDAYSVDRSDDDANANPGDQAEDDCRGVGLGRARQVGYYDQRGDNAGDCHRRANREIKTGS